MSWFVVVFNCVVFVIEGQGIVGGLVVGVFDVLCEIGGIWFGWSGEIVVIVLYELNIVIKGNIIYVIVGLNCKDYDQYYCGFVNVMLWLIFYYCVDFLCYECQEYYGYWCVNVQFVYQFKVLVQFDDIFWVYDYYLILFVVECCVLGLINCIGFFLYILFLLLEILMMILLYEDFMCVLCLYDLVGFQIEIDCVVFYDYIEWEVCGYIEQKEQNGFVYVYGYMLCVEVYLIGVYLDEIVQQVKVLLVWCNLFMWYVNLCGECIVGQG